MTAASGPILNCSTAFYGRARQSRSGTLGSSEAIVKKTETAAATPPHERSRRALSEPSRARVFELLAASEQGLDVRELAGRTGLHPNTVRWHLATLADAGLVATRAEHRATPGRPRIVYEATGDDPEEPEGYRLLAGMLTSSLARSRSAAADAEATGREWGKHLVRRPLPFASEDASDGVGDVVRLLADEGFRPELRDGDVWMHRCPFHGLAVNYGNVICRLHLGLIRGALEQSGSRVGVSSLEPFVEPNLCIARLGPDSGPEAA